MAKSDKRPVIKLKSTAGTGYTYATRKNKTNTRHSNTDAKWAVIICGNVKQKTV